MAVPLPTILVVDDNAAALLVTTRILQKAGYHVAQAEDGAAALREVRALRPSLVLLDVELPDISGLEVLRQIRAEPAWHGVSVVLVSSHRTLPEQQAGGLDGGADGYIARPIASAEFLGRVRSQLRQRDLAEKLRASELRYRRLFEAAKDGILILDAETGMVVEVNPFLVDLLGFSHEEFLGKKVWELGFLKDIVASEANFTELQEKEYIRFENQPLETADGRRIDVEFVSNVYLVEGRKVIQCNIRDISERKRMEAARSESNARIRMVIRSANVGLWDWNLITHEAMLSPEWKRQLGYADDEVPNRIEEWKDRLHPEDRDAAIQAANDFCEGRRPDLATEFRLRHRDGSWRWMMARADLIRDATGRAARMLGCQIDITEQKLADQELRQSGERLAGIVNSAMDAIISVDAQQRIVLFNAAAEKMFGYRSGEMIGQPLDRLIPARSRGAHAHHFDTFAHSGVTKRQIVARDAISGVRANGEEFPIEAAISQVAVAGEQLCTVILRDITERKRAAADHARLAAIVESAEDAIIAKTLEGIVTDWNAAAERLYGYSTEEMVGQLITHVVPPDRRQEWERVQALVLEGAHVPLFETVRTRKDGTLIDVSVCTSPIRDAAGHTTGVSTIARDITAHKRAEADLRRSGEELRALASHFDLIREEQATRIARELHDELGQMLTILKLHVRGLQRQLAAHTGEPSTLESREAEELIEGAVRSVRQLCTELRPPTLDHLGLRQAIEVLAIDFRSRFGIDYTFAVPDDFPALDPQRQTTIYRIVQELLTNVARHAEASEVRIEFRVKDAELEVEVTDNGRGIGAEDTAGNRSLGLLGMRERALAVGGRMTITAHPDGGTTGCAHLPLAQPPAAP